MEQGLSNSTKAVNGTISTKAVKLHILGCHHIWETLIATLTQPSRKPSKPQGIGAQKLPKMVHQVTKR